jgi:hypothetical protein
MQWIRQAGQRLSVGSSRLATLLTASVIRRAAAVWRRCTGWLKEASGVGWLLRLGLLLLAAAVVRKAVTAIAAAVYERAASGAAPGLLWGAAAVWVVSAYRAGADGWAPKRPAAPPVTDEQPQSEPTAGTQKETAEDVGPAPLPGPPSVSPVELVATVRDIGTPHAQLKPIAEYLRTTTDAVRATAAGMGWPVKDVRMQGRSSTAGLRWDDCPSPSRGKPLSDVVGAGQPTDDNDDDGGDGDPGEGVRVERIGQAGAVVRHPADRVRHHTVGK